jgi:radical SAM superfamily enzyme YgiQ (UPF0313 family)
MKNFLLINPWIYDFAAYDFGTKPLGLLRIASYLRRTGETHLIDCLAGCARSKKEMGFAKFRKEVVEKPPPLHCIDRPYFRYGIPVNEFRERLAEVKEPDEVFVASGMTYWYPGVRQAIKITKEFFPRTRITLGGIYATLCFEHATACMGADSVWRGDFIKDGQTCLPAYELLEDTTILPIRMSTGCPFHCSYCASCMLHPAYSQRDPVEVFEEITYYKETFGTRSFVFYDDALLYRADTGIKKLLRMLQAARLGCNFYTPNGLHAKYIDEELACLLKQTGFGDLRLSLETSDEGIQEFTGNKVSNSDMRRAVTLLKEAGFEKKDIGIYILYNAPYFTLNTTKEDIFFVSALGARVILASYSPIPGTKDYESLLVRGIIEPDMDPLWHNNTIFSEKIVPGSIEATRALRRHVSQLNKS